MIGRLGMGKLALGVLAAVAGLALLFASKRPARLWASVEGEGKLILITHPIDESRLVRLRGNTRPEANADNDRGPVPDDFPMEHLLLQLKRAPELEQEFNEYIDSLTDKSSPNFHHWIMAPEQGEKYGLAQEDLDTITDWLVSHGFTVGYVYPNRMVIAFSGTASEIREAFHTEIHYLDVRGEQHFANMSDPEVPQALAPAIVGVVSMHNFEPRQLTIPRVQTNYTYGGCYVTGTNAPCYFLVPGDFQTIYNLNPLYQAGITGKGQTIAVVDDSDTYSNDVATYRSTFLSKWTGTVTTTHPTGGDTCTDPGTNGDDGEADLDAEVASAIAPNATIEVATCANPSGVTIAINNLANSTPPPAIISISYSECEATNTAANNAFYNTAYQTGAGAGSSIFVSAGDWGASSCAPNYKTDTTAYPGIGITGLGETPYNVSVGGTDFEDAYNAVKGSPVIPQSTYWNSTNTATYGSAKSYIPEIPWNYSCAGYLLYNYLGSSTGYGSSGECASAFDTIAAGGGGPSGCATTPGGGSGDQVNGVVDGTCTGYPKPTWQQNIFGNPADGVRDIPDVSLFASNGVWGHYIVVCFSDTSNGGTSCTGAPYTWAGFGGTSASAPMMAAIQALVNEKWNTKEGNPNPTYYSIAKSEFGASGNSACYSINQPPRRGLSTSCAFYDITQGDTDVDCSNSDFAVGCYQPSGTYGSLSTQALNTVTVITKGSGYTSAPTCSLGAPSNLNKYKDPTGTITLWGGGTQAMCSATVSGGKVTSISLTNDGQGYTGGTSCTLTGGGGSGATCSASPTISTAPSTWQPAYGATPGWDFATGIGSVNAYNLVFNKAW